MSPEPWWQPSCWSQRAMTSPCHAPHCPTPKPHLLLQLLTLPSLEATSSAQVQPLVGEAVPELWVNSWPRG